MRTFTGALCAFLFAGIAAAQTRMADIPSGALTPEQKSVVDALMAGPRHSTAGPFNMWLRSPVLADRLQRVGEYLRFSSTIPADLRELTILVAAVDGRAEFEWGSHVPLALQAGVSQAVIDDLKHGRRPSKMTADQALVYEFCTQLQRKKRVTDAAYNAAIARFGEKTVTEIVALLGYYGIVSMTLDVAQVPPPDNAPPVFGKGDKSR